MYMDFPISRVSTSVFSPMLMEITDPPPHIYMRGATLPAEAKYLAVVGSRNYSNYGKQVAEHLISGLHGYNIAIISGLALGIDTIAHTAALEAGLYTLAVPGSGIDDESLYPRRNIHLAQRILERDGGLISEYEPGFKATPWSFPKRNRIMVGLSHAVLLIEASERSGTLITARLTGEYNRDLLAVPGSIFSENSRGVHQFLKLGATPVTSPEDILEALHLDTERQLKNEVLGLGEKEMAVLSILTEPRDHDTIIRLLPYHSEEVLTLLMRMELDGHIKEQNGIFIKLH